MTEIQKALRVLVEAIKSDPGYREAWKANIAMQFQDEFNRSHRSEGVHAISNKAADNFLDLLISEARRPTSESSNPPEDQL